MWQSCARMPVGALESCIVDTRCVASQKSRRRRALRSAAGRRAVERTEARRNRLLRRARFENIDQSSQRQVAQVCQFISIIFQSSKSTIVSLSVYLNKQFRYSHKTKMISNDLSHRNRLPISWLRLATPTLVEIPIRLHSLQHIHKQWRSSRLWSVIIFPPAFFDWEIVETKYRNAWSIESEMGKYYVVSIGETCTSCRWWTFGLLYYYYCCRL